MFLYYLFQPHQFHFLELLDFWRFTPTTNVCMHIYNMTRRSQGCMCYTVIMSLVWQYICCWQKSRTALWALVDSIIALIFWHTLLKNLYILRLVYGFSVVIPAAFESKSFHCCYCVVCCWLWTAAVHIEYDYYEIHACWRFLMQYIDYKGVTDRVF